MDVDKALQRAAEQMKSSLAEEAIPDVPQLAARRWIVPLVVAVVSIIVVGGVALITSDGSPAPFVQTPASSATSTTATLDESEPEPSAEPRPIGPERVIAEGNLEGTDETWRLSVFLTENDGLCMRLRGMTCGPVPDGSAPLSAPGRTISGIPGEPRLVCAFGALHSTVAVVNLTFSDGSTSMAPIYAEGDMPANFYANCWIGDLDIVSVAVIDKDGKTLASSSGFAELAVTPESEEQGQTADVEEGVWRAMPAGPLGRRERAHAFWAGGELLVMGGSDAPPCPPYARCREPNVPALSDGAAFDPVTGEWREIASSPVPLGYASGLVHQDVVYLWVYGFEARPGTETAFLAYDPDEDRWERLPMPTSAPNPAALGEMGDSLILYQTTQENSVGSDMLFDPETREWSALPADPLQPSYDRTMVWTGNELVLLGIKAVPHPHGAEPAFYRAAAYDMTSGTWRRLPDSEVIGWSPTWYPTAGGIINPAVGSSDGGEVNNYGRFYPYGGMLDPISGTWESLPDTPDQRAGFTGHTAGSSRLFLNNEGWVFDASARRWYPLEEPPDAAHDDSAVTWTGSDLIVWGGVSWDTADGELLDTGWMWRPDTE